MTTRQWGKLMLNLHDPLENRRVLIETTGGGRSGVPTGAACLTGRAGEAPTERDASRRRRRGLT